MRTPRTAVLPAAALAVAASALVTPPASADTAPGTAGLDPALANAYSAAYRSAAASGVVLRITSGARSWSQQQWLWEDGIARYGSPDAARRWVLPPGESTHVTGAAIDVGPWEGAAWLQANGNRWGLCRTFDNEWWHFERVTAPGGACPPTVPDAAHR
ncbi:peptidase M15 [Tsukamurella pulmonis]|uniref:D-alanyl-D-alanine carboxypeptidase n=1 Tax=Tsukamurella pulmonis TaxID=47312 RepID=A0A1H1FRJ5_9ACTN|nr:M15 family metallopeptidase [Tsukamurella pulmonis]KXO87941.1 peptidase M15 [Tsukamurella pulmonis]SDR03622.1 D-alanyl-D-alanine carboxypeptidase [Tsukamurella pulmonis]SUP18532.1 D-alanyl-D-alanine carboxypeptidase [Tsukamurella pulmonis]